MAADGSSSTSLAVANVPSGSGLVWTPDGRIDEAGMTRGSSRLLAGQEGVANIWGFAPDDRLLRISSRGGIFGRIVEQRPDESMGRLLSRSDGQHHDDLPTINGDTIVFARRDVIAASSGPSRRSAPG